jgi:hypothetical protein
MHEEPTQQRPSPPRPPLLLFVVVCVGSSSKQHPKGGVCCVRVPRAHTLPVPCPGGGVHVVSPVVAFV